MNRYSVLATRNLKGKEFEKQGKIDDAIKIYELNVKDKTDTPFTYNRLAIIYHKQNRIDDEIRILEQAVKYCPWEDKFRLRLQKLTSEGG